MIPKRHGGICNYSCPESTLTTTLIDQIRLTHSTQWISLRWSQSGLRREATGSRARRNINTQAVFLWFSGCKPAHEYRPLHWWAAVSLSVLEWASENVCGCNTNEIKLLHHWYWQFMWWQTRRRRMVDVEQHGKNKLGWDLGKVCICEAVTGIYWMATLTKPVYVYLVHIQCCVRTSVHFLFKKKNQFVSLASCSVGADRV